MKKTLLAAALLPCAMAAHADQNDQPQSLSTVVVTATRTAITTDEALSSVTVITRADIDRLQPTSVRDLLVGLPGVSFAQSGGLGQQSSLFLRGTNSDHVLVLIDGVRMGSVTTGAAALEQIPVDQIERIEIVRGPRSSLYGSDAVGGVIQIFTRHGTQDGKLDPSLSVSTGSRSYWDSHAGLSGGDSHAWFNVGLGGQYTAGINACRVGAAELGVACFVDDPNDDAYRNWNGMANGGYRWDNGTELSVTWLRSKSFVEYAGSPYGGNQAEEEQEVAGARLSFTPLDLWKVTLNAGQSRDDSANYYQGTYNDPYAGTQTYYPRVPVFYAYSRRNQASWQNDITLASNQLLTAGVDYQQEHINSDTGYLESTREDTGAFLQYLGTFGRNEVQLAARHDHNDQFGNHNTGSAAWGYAFDDGVRLSASYGTAFHTPTFNDMYYPFGYGNADLKPEKSRSGELGLSQKQDNWNWAVNAYQTTITDLIILDENYVPQNISRARIRGLEGQFGVNVYGWQVQSYLTLMQPKNEEGTYDGNQLPRRPEQTARIDIDRRFGAFGVGATYFASGKAYDDQANQYRLGGYTTTDLRASYDFLPSWRVELKLANVFDRNYETAYYYNQPGRSWYLTLRYSPATR
ncbi:TonB-dependent vitamin B12 receptor [Dyella sp. C9]|uniref:TonB-dependent vitamin B12 receptor n=1 Tax=Dyella sp. C9 TaxID=2202154 RepID=UPI000DEFD788|nr:TonB-dependent vitamin B12 receptor [Dyella sp. C9]